MENNTADRVKDQVEEVKEAYEQGKQAVREMSQAAVSTSKEAVAFTDEWVRGNSWKLLGVAAALGLLFGLLLSRRSSEPAPERLPV
jgi:ElaB/YqjD/DUF883 family membrane-anchored ribosome-binding protein